MTLDSDQRDSDQLAGSVLDALAIDRVDERRFLSRVHEGPARRTFGGEVAGQAVLAAGMTVPAGRRIHAAHTYFLLPGDTTARIEFEIDQVRDGRAFSARRVDARQNGRTIFTMIASFHRDERGLEHQVASLDVPDPEDLPGPETTFGGSAENLAWARNFLNTLGAEARFPSLPARALAALDQAGEPHQSVWLRSRRRVPDGFREQAACLTYFTDALLLSTALGPHGRTLQDGTLQFATVNHTVWFHAPIRVDEWFLYDQHSRWAGGARALCHGEVLDRSGRLCATTMQEGLLRPV
ncbi:MAG: thioesterase family protein [Frankia sp.]|nr:thioesterase family protein [Frankia sp.]